MGEDIEIEALLQKAAGLRAGLRPLPVHVVSVLGAYARDPALFGRLSGDMAAMIAGIQAYQNHPFRREMPPLREVWRTGEAHLSFYPQTGHSDNGTAFIIPSMINRSAILDLLPGRSFVRWLGDQGYNVCLLDWGDPVNDKDMQSIGEVIRDRLVPALEFAEREYGGPVDAIGYCMGGTLLAAAAALTPESLRRLVFLASPWDFHAGDRLLATQIQAGTPSALQMIAEKGSLPANWIQSVFAAINAERTVQKFANFPKLEPDGEQAQLFVAVEDWLNDGIDFPGQMADDCIVGWYGKNIPGRGQWKIGRKTINAARVKIPSLVVASAHDRLVPEASSLALAGILPNCDILQPATGHIGMMTGRRAAPDVWKPVLQWLEKPL
jgi:polyhydroxyalkanoate synthase